MRTLHPAYRVSDLAASLDFYAVLGYEQVGRVDLDDSNSLTMLRFPGEELVTLELVHRPGDGRVDVGTGFSHLAVQVDNLGATIEAYCRAGLVPAGWNCLADQTDLKPLGSRIPTATGSNWSNGRQDMPTGSQLLTLPDRRRNRWVGYAVESGPQLASPGVGHHVRLVLGHPHLSDPLRENTQRESGVLYVAAAAVAWRSESYGLARRHG